MNRRNVLKFLGFSAAAAGIQESTHIAEASSDAPAPGFAFNQVGYLPRAEKIASLGIKESFGSNFQVIAAQSRQPVFEGKLHTAMHDTASGDLVALADFTYLSAPGLYRIAARGRDSDTFQISKDAYREPLRVAMRAFYGQRCGCVVDLGGGYRHDTCHVVGAYHRSSGKQGPAFNNGGWHDAGDYGRYVVNSGITTGTLLWTWELYSDSLRNLALDIPESGGKIPDYLAEVRWNLDWMLSLQDSDGGVWHKQTSEQFCSFIMPEKDALTSYVIGTGSAPYKSTCATADLAAVAAIAARCYGQYDDAFAARCLAAARQAWRWAVAHPNIIFTNPPGVGTGGYDDPHCNDEILWASAELWRTTGEKQYEQAFLAGTVTLPPESSIRSPSWADVAPMAYWTYALAERSSSQPLIERIRKQTVSAAEALIHRRNASGYGNTLETGDYIWGSNSVAANQSLLLLVAHRLQPAPQALSAALGNLHYLLGRNCFAVSWVTHFGNKPFQRPHHRPSAADGIAAPWPGLLSGGPNASPADQVARTLTAQSPMRMWIDDQNAYSMNEVAINWNAPLVFLLAAANSLV
jgi:endoglucanase